MKIIDILIFLIIIMGLIGILNYLWAYAMPLNLSIETNRVITGDPSLAAYISLNQGNRVLNNEVDNNNMIFEEKLKNISKFIQDIKDTGSLVIIRQGEGIYARIKEFREFIQRECVLLNSDKEFLVMECD